MILDVIGLAGDIIGRIESYIISRITCMILDMIYDSRYDRIGGRYNREDKQDVRL